MVDDGWVWHPVGIPSAWSLERWLCDNVWESEDGPSKIDICGREYYWDEGIAWLDNETVALAGIGDDEMHMIDGARVFDITTTAKAAAPWRSTWLCAREISAFAGPAGKFFSDGAHLYSAADDGLSVWDTKDGVRIGHIEKFRPTHYHAAAGELAQLSQGRLIRWRTSERSWL